MKSFYPFCSWDICWTESDSFHSANSVYEVAGWVSCGEALRQSSWPREVWQVVRSLLLAYGAQAHYETDHRGQSPLNQEDEGHHEALSSQDALAAWVSLRALALPSSAS